MTQYELDRMFEAHRAQVDSGSNGYMFSSIGIDSLEMLVVTAIGISVLLSVLVSAHTLFKVRRAKKAAAEKKKRNVILLLLKT